MAQLGSVRIPDLQIYRQQMVGVRQKPDGRLLLFSYTGTA